jgi:hypothetical protein
MGVVGSIGAAQSDVGEAYFSSLAISSPLLVINKVDVFES